MSWLGLIRLVLAAADKALGFASDRQLLDAGAAKAARAGLREILDATKSKRARDLRLARDPDLARRVHNAVRRAAGR